MDISTIVLFIIGIGLLIGGAELLVRGASAIAAVVGLSPLVIGLTVVAFGTSSPELAVSLSSAFGGQADIAVANAVGSNIFNILLILGISALITPLVVAQQLIRLDVPLMIVLSVLLFVLSLDGRLGMFDGLLLFVGIVVYIAFSIWQSRRESKQVQAEYGTVTRPSTVPAILAQLGMVVGGLLLLVLGSRWLVEGATAFAQILGVSDAIIGLTIVAAGTSLPEVATSVIAALRGQRDIAVGNVVGSNIFNILAILGISATVAPGGLPVPPSIISFDMPIMIAVALACLPIFFTGRSIARWEGGLFLAYYVAYTTYLVLAATQHDALPAFSAVLAIFVLPITAVTLIVLLIRAIRHGPDDATALPS